MSSPLSTLGKNRRPPLPEQHKQGRRAVPFKQSPYTEHEAALLNEILTPGLNRPAAVVASEDFSVSRSKVALKKSSANGSAPSDFELMSTMMDKLTQLEKKVQSQTQDIKLKDRKIAVLEEKLQILQRSKEETTASQREGELVATCSQLQSQVSEMERFLNDYGMVWVGESTPRAYLQDPGEEESERTQPWKQAPAPSSVGHAEGRDFQVNFDLVLENVRDLNVLAGEGESHVERVAGGARLARSSAIPLSLFRNGIVMFEGPFRPYEEPHTRQCVQDLMDGYFPSELQTRFPDGVPFEVRDRRDEVYRQSRRWEEFPGEGRMVGGVPETGHAAGPRLSVEQFLNRLPKAVIKEGKVIDIRGSIRDNLQGPSQAQGSRVTLIETPALQALKQRLELSEDIRPPTPANVSTLRVKSEDGEQTYIVKMLFSETIGQLRQHLDTHRGDDRPHYDIISSFPPRSYSDGSQTLLQCGLTPNATLLLRARPRATPGTGP
ncbi:UBX domain-containing protein 11 [Amia ocellicauda]|uniref:UBX domain-containing protein 11 n=1 Tax=Amia ocellicauda TaxID=2972642 RepID=UPI003464897A